MLHITFNIGYEGRSLNSHPIYYQIENFKDFSDMLRRDAFILACWASDNYISKYHLYLYIYIYEDIDSDTYNDWNFSVKCENIREYKPYLNLQREEMEQLKIEISRENKLNKILNF